MQQNIFAERVNEYAKKRTPFLFIIDFESKKPFVCRLDKAAENGLIYDINGKTNAVNGQEGCNIELKYFPIDESLYIERFNSVLREINEGNSYLLNLTFPTQIEINVGLQEIFNMAKAPYKLLMKDQFVVFSPECFIRIKKGKIFTYPMKGTIDASIKDAEQILMQNKKEEAEHNIIVDLMRNDLSMVAKKVQVSKYRFVQKIKTHKNEILQTSSEIQGQLKEEWKDNLGGMLLKMLPAGSISGAPKLKTVQIIKENELVDRGYYTGIFGVFDGKHLDSGVAIRYIEKSDGKMFFKSGGGITSMSKAEEEYNELIQKVYIPTV